MMDDVRLGQLTREIGWIRGLARALVALDADDLAQDVWLVAAEQAPADRPLRPWLARVTGNLARMRGRSSSRRQRRELAVDTVATPTPAELVERVELGRVVAAEVIALDEPYRSTILLHFFEGLSSVEVARRLDIPDGTVRRRLKVALDQLRERLRDRRDPPKGGWLAALIPVAGPMPRVKAIAKPAVATTTSSTTIVIAAIVVAIVAGAIWKLAAPRDDDARVVSTAPPIARVYPIIGPREPGVAVIDPALLAQPGAPPRRVAGIVRAGGMPVLGAVVHLGVQISERSIDPDAPVTHHRVAQVTTTADGRFDFGSRPAASYIVTAQTADLRLGSQRIEVADPDEPVDAIELALAACTTTLAGRVRDAQGTGLAAHVERGDLAGIDTSPAGDYRLCIDRLLRRGPWEYYYAPPIVRVTADGYAAIKQTVSGAGDVHHDFVMVPGATVFGRVVDEEDHPVLGARVFARPMSYSTVEYASERWAATDERGRFEIDQLAGGRWTIRALATAVGPAGDVVATVAAGVPGRDVRLVVTPALHARGRVVHDGVPVSGARIRDGTYSQPDGTFVIDDVATGRLVLHIDDYIITSELPMIDRQDQRFEVTVIPHSRITGHVTQLGVPVQGATVWNDSYTRTDASGAYSLPIPLWHRAGTEVGIQATLPCDPNEPEGSTWRTEAHATAMLAANKAAILDVDLSPCRERNGFPPELPGFHGFVADASGAAVVGALVTFGSNEAATDDHGGFGFDVAYASGTFNVFTGHEAQAPLPILDRSGDGTTTPLRVVVDAGLISIHGRVLDPAGVPVTDARVQVHGQLGSRAATSADDTFAATTGTDGAFTIDHLARSTSYTLTAVAGLRRGEVRGVGGDVDIVVGGNGSIHGELDGDWGATKVVVRRIGEAGELAASLDDNEFVLRDIPSGVYEVFAYDGVVEGDAQVLVPSGGVARTTLWGRGGRTRSFHATMVELGSSAPISGMACQGGPHMPIVVSDAQGTITTDYPAGTCWCSRGPYVPIGASLAPEEPDAPTRVSLVRPGSAQPGFVVAPSSWHPIVAVVDENRAAKQAGLEAGDAIVELDGAGVAQLSPQELMYLVWTHPGGTLRLTVDRDGSRREISIPIGE